MPPLAFVLWTTARPGHSRGTVTEVYDALLRVRLACPDDWLDRAIATLGPAGLVVDPGAGVGISIAPGRQVSELVDEWSVESLPHLLVGAWQHTVAVGPWVVPGISPCARCVAASTFDDGERVRPGPPPAALLTLAAGWAARDMADWARGATPSTWLCSWAFDHSPLPRNRRWERHPYCGCSWFEMA